MIAPLTTNSVEGRVGANWEPDPDRPLTAIEQALLARVLERLPPVEFEPWWVQATVGFAIRF